jgi:hypothetical protein
MHPVRSTDPIDVLNIKLKGSKNILKVGAQTSLVTLKKEKGS